MQYAESKLLCGEIIDASDVDIETYEELIPVCLVTKKRVRLVTYPAQSVPEWDTGELIHTWTHIDKIPYSTLNLCYESNQHYGKESHTINSLAYYNRLKLLNPNLIKLIKNSAVFEQPATVGNLDNLFDGGLMHWLVDFLIEIVRNKVAQNRFMDECQNLYDNCIKESMADKSSYFYQFVDSNFTAPNHKVYGSKIASEMLGYALANLQGQDIIELIHLGVNEPVQESMRIAADKISSMAASTLEPDEKSEFWEWWKANKYLGMNRIKEFSKKSPNLRFIYKKYIAEVLHKFSLNLCLIFWFVPWLDELKKLNQQSQTQ
ncbi:MAG: hypothetical protein AAGJ08_01805 [Cyanobacteria bacterium P01_H01_bin.35]